MLFNKKKRIFNAHKVIGFPPFPKEKQLEMVVKSNYEDIGDLTDYGEWTYDILDYYINLSVDELALYLIETGYLNNHIIKENTTQDGVWIIPQTESVLMIDQERGIVYNKKELKTINDGAIYFAKILLSNIPKYEKYKDWDNI